MLISCPLSVTAVLAASLVALPVLRPHIDPPTDTTSPPPAQKDDVLRGPKVPQKGIDSDRQFTGGKAAQRAAAAGGSRPTIEQNAFFAALDSMKFEGELKKSVEDARTEFVERVKEWDKSAGEQRRKLFEERKKAASNEPPSEEFKKKMTQIEASRPKLAELQQRVFGLLTEEQGAKLKEAFDAELKRVRDEIARKTEAERKKQAADRKRSAQPARGPGDSKPTPPAEKPTDAPPAEEPMQPKP
ncbi:MAG: hypothetical protein RLY21_1739 [Planctomycetota bacterium]